MKTNEPTFWQQSKNHVQNTPTQVYIVHMVLLVVYPISITATWNLLSQDCSAVQVMRFRDIASSTMHFHKLCNIFGLMNCIHAFGMWHVILDLEYYCIYRLAEITLFNKCDIIIYILK